MSTKDKACLRQIAKQNNVDVVLFLYPNHLHSGGAGVFVPGSSVATGVATSMISHALTTHQTIQGYGVTIASTATKKVYAYGTYGIYVYDAKTGRSIASSHETFRKQLDKRKWQLDSKNLQLTAAQKAELAKTLNQNFVQSFNVKLIKVFKA